jgi:hypothetical protein
VTVDAHGHVDDPANNEWFNPSSLRAAEVDYPRGSAAKAGVCWVEDQKLGSVEFHHVSTTPIRYDALDGTVVPALDESAPGFNSSNFHYLLPVNLLTLGYKPC